MHGNYEQRICQLISNNTSILKRVKQTLGINQPFDNQLSKNKNKTFLRSTGERMKIIEDKKKKKKKKKKNLYGGNTKPMRSPY